MISSEVEREPWTVTDTIMISHMIIISSHVVPLAAFQGDKKATRKKTNV